MGLLDRLFKARNTVTSSNPLDERMSDALIPPWQDGKRLYHPQDFQAQINNNIKWVYRAVQIISDAASSAPFRLYTMKNSSNLARVFEHRPVAKQKTEWLEANNPSINRMLRKSGTLIEITDHPYYDLIRSVNPHMNESDIKKLKWTSDRLTGNAYWYKVKNAAGRPVRLWPLPTSRVSIIPDKHMFIKGYELQMGVGSSIFFDESDVIHFKDPTVGNAFYGMSPMAAIVDSVTLQAYMDQFDRDLFHNKAVPQVALETDEPLTAPVVERILKGWMDRLSFITGNSGKPVILSNGLKVKSLTMSPQELNYNEGQTRIRDEILGIFGVPLTKVDPSLIKANTDAADRQFLRDTIYPLLIRDQEKLNEKLLPEFDSRLVGAYDNPVPDDKDFQLKENVALVKAGIVTRNEIRERDGMEPLPPEDGDMVPPFRGINGSTVTDEDAKAIAAQVRKSIYGGMLST